MTVMGYVDGDGGGREGKKDGATSTGRVGSWNSEGRMGGLGLVPL